MDQDELLEFYRYRFFKKLDGMQPMERVAFMEEFFGKRWMDVYSNLLDYYPVLMKAPNVGAKAPT